MDVTHTTASLSTTPTSTVDESNTGSSTRRNMGRQSIKVKHNMEMAHRLSQTPGKCQQIHGHSWWAELEIQGPLAQNGTILEFGLVKKAFRSWLDTTFDHHLLLNKEDPILLDMSPPGTTVIDVDPTTENVARMIGEWAQGTFGPEYEYFVTLWETSVNCATWRSDAPPLGTVH